MKPNGMRVLSRPKFSETVLKYSTKMKWCKIYFK